MNAIGQITNTININTIKITDLESSITKLENYISAKESRQRQLTNLISDIHERFFKKYARYIQEGTWQDSNYIDDDKYYLDAVDIAYTSSRPQL
jgi:predicted  nucleic acid-binding Zn-ribbon protein